MSDSPYTEESMFKRYKELCARRDATYAAKADLENKLEDALARLETARLEAEKYAKEIDEKYLTPAHFALKKEIAILAHNLGRPYGVLATKE